MAKKKTDPTEEISNSIGLAVGAGVHVPSRKIFLLGEIDRDRTASFMASFMSLDATEGPIHVVLCSEGGGVEHGFAIYDTIKLSSNPVIIDVFGMAQSAGIFILQAGDIRRASPESRLMMHQGSFNIESASFKAHEMHEQVLELEYHNQRIFKVLADATKGKMTLEDVKKACAKDTYLSPEDALKLGLIDAIISSDKRVELIVGD
jgi:ATP-dependent Clp protease protease subunit